MATVSLLDCLVLRNLLGVLFQRRVDRLLDLLVERRLVLLDGQDVVGFGLTDLLGDLLLAAHRIDRDQCPGDLQQLQQFRNRRDLVGFLLDHDLTQRQLVLRGPGRTM